MIAALGLLGFVLFYGAVGLWVLRTVISDRRRQR